MRFLFIALLALLTYSSLSAEIALLEVVRAGATNCEASITVRATGTAGPFTVLVTSGSDSLIYDQVNGDLTIGELCNTNYDIEVFPTQYPTCGKYFKVAMNTLDGGKINPAPRLERDREPATAPTDKQAIVLALKPNELLVEATPNPTFGPVTITVYSAPQAVIQPGEKLDVTLLSGSGAAVQRFSTPRTGTTTAFLIPDSKLRSGTYLVQVRTGKGQKEGVCRLVVQ
jgi:hypothetical protein